MGWTKYEYENQFVNREEIEINGIPCLKFRPQGREAESLPTVVYYHGWKSSKDFQRLKGTVLATYGYQVIVPDAPYHGDRDPIDHDESHAIGEYFWKVIFQAVSESTALIESLSAEHGADPQRIGVMGSSMGGFIASGVFLANQELKCLINFNGSCAWVKAEEIFRNRDGMPPANSEEIMHFAKYDPMFHKAQLKQRPILMLHGTEDTSVPIDSQKFFYHEVSSLYKEHPERLKLVEVERMNHYISIGMLEEALGWLKTYL